MNNKRTLKNQAQSAASSVKVFVRVRPFSEKESSSNPKLVVKIYDEKCLIFDPKVDEESFFFHGVAQRGRDINKKEKKNMVFEFDRVFDENSTNDEVYEATTKSLIASVFEGYNCSVFAYGATGAGKTFTMLGNQSQPGITYLTIVQLLSHLDAIKDTFNVTVGASYLEVYNENVRDLLHPNSPVLQLREDNGRVTVAGLRIDPINNPQTLFTLLERGNENRSQHPTDSNAESSRSHAVFQVHVRMVTKSTGQVKLSKLSMIDLAGSERGVATGCSGLRFKEGSNINKSLLALGNCINALADGLKHVPYRDSKLTRILKDSLGGNCQTVMVANVSPHAASYEDTYNTLKYANRAKSIKSKLSKNVLTDVMTIPQYKRLVEELRTKIAKFEAQGLSPDLEEWINEIDAVMNERKFIHIKIFTLLSEQKTIEWRLKAKQQALSVQDANNEAQWITRVNASIGQLKARHLSIGDKLNEFLNLQVKNTQKKEQLIEKIKTAKLSDLLKLHLEAWNEKIHNAEASTRVVHFQKMWKLQMNLVESRDAAMFSIIVPTFNEFYNLLHAHSHITQPLIEKHQEAMRSLDGVKAVSWKCGDTSDEDEDSINSINQFLTLEIKPPVKMEEDNTNEEKVKVAFTEKRVAPLKPRNTTPPPAKISKGVVSRLGVSKSKLNINKENVATPLPSLGKQKITGAVNNLKINRTKTAHRVHPYQSTTSNLIKKKLVLP